MGRVTVKAVVTNIHDFYRLHLGEIAESDVRKFEIAEALVDTGASPQELLLELRPTLPFVSPPDVPSVRGLPASPRDGCTLDSNFTSSKPPFGSA